MQNNNDDKAIEQIRKNNQEKIEKKLNITLPKGNIKNLKALDGIYIKQGITAFIFSCENVYISKFFNQAKISLIKDIPYNKTFITLMASHDMNIFFKNVFTYLLIKIEEKYQSNKQYYSNTMNVLFYLSARYNKLEYMKKCMDYYTSCNLEFKACDGYFTSLHHASHHNNLEMVEWLVNNGANIFAKDYKNRLPLDYSVKHLDSKAYDYLLKLTKHFKKEAETKLPTIIPAINPTSPIIVHRKRKWEPDNSIELNLRKPFDLNDFNINTGFIPLISIPNTSTNNSVNNKKFCISNIISSNDKESNFSDVNQMPMITSYNPIKFSFDKNVRKKQHASQTKAFSIEGSDQSIFEEDHEFKFETNGLYEEWFRKNIPTEKTDDQHQI